MKQFSKFAIALGLVAVLAGGASAQKAKPKTMTCPSCKMPMAMTKSKGAPVAVKTKNGTFYCCAGCPSGKAAMKKKK